MNWERAKRVELEAELAKLKHHITRLEGEAVNLQSKLKESSEKVKTLEVTNKVLRDLHGNEAEYGVGNFFK